LEAKLSMGGLASLIHYLDVRFRYDFILCHDFFLKKAILSKFSFLVTKAILINITWNVLIYQNF